MPPFQIEKSTLEMVVKKGRKEELLDRMFSRNHEGQDVMPWMIVNGVLPWRLNQGRSEMCWTQN